MRASSFFIRRFELEHAERVARHQELVRGAVALGQSVEIGCRAAELRDVAETLLEDRQGAQPQVIHLQEAELLELRRGPLRAHVVAVLRERHVLDDRLVGDHDAGGVRRDVARQTFEGDREPEHLLDVGAILLARLQVRFGFERFFRLGAFGPAGIFLLILSTSPSGMSSARPTSRTTVREAIVPNVTICATFSSP
jgi:hypothetical protein